MAHLQRYLACLLAGAIDVTTATGGQLPVKPRVRSVTRLVEVYAVVTDSHGQPITGLTRDDFIIRDEGRTQTVSLFEEPPPQGQTGISLQQGPEASSSTNRSGAGQGSVTVLLLDCVNSRFEDQSHAQAELREMIPRIATSDRIALYILASRLQLAVDFTSDRELLTKAIENFRPAELAALRSSEPARSELHLFPDPYLNDEAIREADYILPNRRIRPTLAALGAILGRLAQIPGRKNLIWAASSFPTEGAAAMASASNVAIYPVSLMGLVAPKVAPDNFRVSTDGGVYGSPYIDPESDSVLTAGEPRQHIYFMEDIAKYTGGRAFFNGNDLGGALVRALEDSHEAYVLGFYPDHGKWDGSYRKLDVRVRRAGAHVEARRGYLAAADPAPAEDSMQTRLAWAVVNPLDDPGIGLEVHLDAKNPHEGARFSVSVRMDGHELGLQPESGKWLGQLQLLYLQRRPNGEALDLKKAAVRFRLATEEYRKMLAEGFQVNTALTRVAGAEQLRVIVSSDSAGTIGSSTLPIPTTAPGTD